MEPITKVTINLFSKDVEWFKRHHPHAYQEAIRDAIRTHIRYIEALSDEHHQQVE
jgi:hypothetical protein